MDAATARTETRRDLKDESSVRWSDNEIDRAVAKALDEYSAAYPLVASTDVAKGSTDTLDVSAVSSYVHAVWLEYPIDDSPVKAIRFREERRGMLRILERSQPVTGDDIRVWYVKARALADVEALHEDLIVLGAAAFALAAAASGATGALNVSGWTPRQYKELAEGRLNEFRDRLKALSDSWVSGAPAAVWSSAEL